MQGLFLSFDAVGYAIGGVSVGEPADVKTILQNLQHHYYQKYKPRYLMGVGTPEDLLDGIKYGVDMFDCVLPIRMPVTAPFFTWEGKSNIKTQKYEDDARPLVEGCDCYACRNHLQSIHQTLMEMSGKQQLQHYYQFIT